MATRPSLDIKEKSSQSAPGAARWPAVAVSVASERDQPEHSPLVEKNENERLGHFEKRQAAFR